MSHLKFHVNTDELVTEALNELKCSQPALFVDTKNKTVLSNKVRIQSNYFLLGEYHTVMVFLLQLCVYVTIFMLTLNC